MHETNIHAAEVGLLLAAGRSRRMGRDKLLLPWPERGAEKTVFQSALHDLRDIVADGPIVVMTSADREKSLRDLHVQNDRVMFRVADGAQPMFATIRSGLQFIQSQWPACRGVWLHPADHPTISPLVRGALRRVVNDDPTRIALPEHAGKGGHPVWIPHAWIGRLAEIDPPGGLRTIWEQFPEAVRRIPVADSTCTLDLDTPRAYEQAIADSPPES